MNEFIKSSLYVYTGGTSIKQFLKIYLTDGTFRYICAFRLVNDREISKLLGIFLWFLADICQVKRTVSDFRGVWGLSQKHSSGNEWIRYRYGWGRYGASSAIAKARLSAIKETDCL